MEMIWATRGRDWGFRFLLDGGLGDPLLTYEEVFRGMNSREGLVRVGRHLGVRFPDPEGRRDAAGRIIHHDIVVGSGKVSHIEDPEEVRRQVWEVVGTRYARIWDGPAPERMP